MICVIYLNDQKTIKIEGNVTNARVTFLGTEVFPLVY